MVKGGGGVERRMQEAAAGGARYRESIDTAEVDREKLAVRI